MKFFKVCSILMIVVVFGVLFVGSAFADPQFGSFVCPECLSTDFALPDLSGGGLGGFHTCNVCGCQLDSEGNVVEHGDRYVESDQFVITAPLVAPIQNAIHSGLSTLVPIGIGIMAVFVGIGLIPRIIFKFL